MKRFLALFLILWVSCAQADGIVIEPYTGGVAYSFQTDEKFVVLECKTETETVRQTLYAQDGQFSGTTDLLYTFDPSYVRLTVETLSGYDLLSERVDSITMERTIPEQNLAEESKCRKLRDVEITPMLNAMGYHFRAPGRASVLLEFRSSTEKGTVTLYAGEDYVYDGVLELPYTYHNSNVVLIVSDINNAVDLYEDMVRTTYPMTEMPQQGSGRLNGITVCIDPGHQEEGQYIYEEIGPGLPGTKKTSPGMARGTVTKRMESIVVLEISLVLREVLMEQGATVVMTRDIQETYVSNIDRAAIAADAEADFFLRLHGNNRDNETIQGIGIFCPVGSDYAKAIDDTDGWQTMCDILLAAIQKTTGQTRGGTSLTNDYIGNNWATMPSFLIEMGYMSNTEEDLLLSCRAYQEMLAYGMADGVYELAVYRGLIED